MSLDQLKELFKSGNVAIQGVEDKKKLEEYLEKIKEVEKYKVTENYFGVAHSDEQIRSLSELLSLVKNDSITTYTLVPIQ